MDPTTYRVRICATCGEANNHRRAFTCEMCGGTLGEPIEVVPAPELPAPGQNTLGPFARGSSTSRQAALDHYPRSGSLRARVLEAVYRAGHHGATSDELAERHGWRLYSVKPRLIELRRGGWLQLSGETRPSVTGSPVDVHVATARARERLDAELSVSGRS